MNLGWNFYPMRVALLTTYTASRKEPLVAVMDRVHQGFLDAGLQPFIHFNFADGGVVSFSSVDRVLKRHPELDALCDGGFAGAAAKDPGRPPALERPAVAGRE